MPVKLKDIVSNGILETLDRAYLVSTVLVTMKFVKNAVLEFYSNLSKTMFDMTSPDVFKVFFRGQYSFGTMVFRFLEELAENKKWFGKIIGYPDLLFGIISSQLDVVTSHDVFDETPDYIIFNLNLDVVTSHGKQKKMARGQKLEFVLVGNNLAALTSCVLLKLKNGYNTLLKTTKTLSARRAEIEGLFNDSTTKMFKVSGHDVFGL